MSIILISGDHPRHKYFVKSLITTGLVVGLILEKRENFIPVAPKNISKKLSTLFDHHFLLRDKVESEFFQINQDINIPAIEVSKESLNSIETISFIKKMNPKLVLSYGCHKIDKSIINSFKCKFWNTHGGLSPWYRGTITHFWPSYFLEPQMTGVTLHETSDLIDGGNILFQTSPEMVKGDGIHQLASRSIRKYINILKEKLIGLDYNNLPNGRPQSSTGKVFKTSDWKPEHLEIIYDKYDDSIVDLYLSGGIKNKLPNLISVL